MNINPLHFIACISVLQKPTTLNKFFEASSSVFIHTLCSTLFFLKNAHAQNELP